MSKEEPLGHRAARPGGWFGEQEQSSEDSIKWVPTALREKVAQLMGDSEDRARALVPREPDNGFTWK